MGHKKKVTVPVDPVKILRIMADGEYLWSCLDGKLWKIGDNVLLRSSLYVDVGKRLEWLHRNTVSLGALANRAIDGNVWLERRVRGLEKGVLDLGKAMIRIAEGMNSNSNCIIQLTDYLKKGVASVSKASPRRRPPRRS